MKKSAMKGTNVGDPTTADALKLVLRAFEDDESVTVMTISSRYVRGTVFLGLVSTLSAAEVMLRIALQVEVERDLAMSHAPTLVSVSGFFKDAYEDAKGMRRILYFPRLEITEGELREVEEEFAHSSTHRSDS
jgi:hypothetical protein